jgi:hypothetical protein
MAKHDCWADPLVRTCAIAPGVELPVSIARLNTGQKIKLARIVVALSGQVRGMIAEDVGGTWEAAERLGEQLEDLVRRFVRLREAVTVGDRVWTSIEDLIALQDPNLLSPLMWMLHAENSVSADLAKNSSSPPASAPGSGDSPTTASGDVPAPVVSAAAPNDSETNGDARGREDAPSGTTTGTPMLSA